MRSLFLPSCGLILSSVLIIVGLFFLLIYPYVLEYFVNKEFQLSPTSQSFKHWRKTPIPITLDFYLFNWTNPRDIGKDYIPAFNELGPYRFYETREKVNITWNRNGTVSYRQVRTWHFNQAESAGSLEDVVTTVNGVTLTAAYMLRNSGYIHQKSVDMAFGFTQQRISVSHSVRDLLFDGYTNNLMTIANNLPKLTDLSSPFDKFAWFYLRNASHTFDGWFNLDTGVSDMSKLGTVHAWNNKKDTGFFSGSCGEVRGFSGDLFPPGLIGKETRLELFSQDLCRTLPFQYSNEEEVHGLQGHKFIGRTDFVDSESRDEDNSCFCNGECLPSGLMNMTSCRFGAPVFVSFPHFLDANPVYLSRVQGLRPDPQRHQFYFTVEPTYGIPIDVGARVQLNMLMQPFSHFSMYKKVPKTVFPVLWVDQRVTISERLARELRMALLLPTVGVVTGCSALITGIVLLINLVLRARRKPSDQEPVKPPGHVALEQSQNQPSTPTIKS
ncbi:protein croquemort-like [Homalodisca vitripennis]|uniref:protein croquemort-like n=1 Tax=Homalodisca vitripennis TaxID=197043 RepID=UPI001EECB977|nr:protein croquemort-like [Homalodisca vitripennis]XP_046663677.1 protein croquemort-like [Homalodisca vitripennis]